MKKVLSGGVFDLLTTGHIFFARMLHSFGDYVILNITPDNVVKYRKGENRPIRSAQERMYTMLGVKGIDEVTSVPTDNMSLTGYDIKLNSRRQKNE